MTKKQKNNQGGCVFCKIVAGELPCHKIWEDEKHMAFLTIFPNTDGFSVVIPKAHYESYAFEVEERVLIGLVLASKKVAVKIDKAFDDVGRTGMMFEGFGVDHLHSKLYPMHGTGEMSKWKAIESPRDEFYEQYPGYLSSHDSKRADDGKLAKLAEKIRNT